MGREMQGIVCGFLAAVIVIAVWLITINMVADNGLEACRQLGYDYNIATVYEGGDCFVKNGDHFVPVAQVLN